MHYFCEGGCGGHAGAPASCHAQGCSKIGDPFTECDCGDEQSHAKQDDQPNQEHKAE